MKKIAIIILLFALSLPQLVAQDKDSLFQVVVTHAAHNNISALRPLYKKYGKEFPHHIQIFCEMAIARNEGRYDNMVDFIDSLRLWYPKQIKTRTQLSLAELKAEGLRQMGEYEAMKDFCKSEIRILKRKGLRDSHLKELFAYQRKATRLLGDNPRSRLLQLADRNCYFQLDSLYNAVGQNVDAFTRLRCKFTLARAFQQCDTVLSTSKALVTNYLDSLDTEELSKCLRSHADILIQRGEWETLGKWTEKINQLHRSHYAPVLLYKKLTQSLSHHSPFKVEKPEEDCYLPSSYEWPFLFSVKVNGSEDLLFTVATEQPHTLLTEEIAQRQQVEILEDTVLLTSSHGILEAHPAWIKQLAIGHITLENVYAYVVLPSNEMPAPFSCAIGWHELMALGEITLLPEQLCIAGSKDDETHMVDRTKNLFVTEQNELCLQSYDSFGTPQPFSLDLSFPNNLVSQRCLPKEKFGNNPEVKWGEDYGSINTPIFVEPKSRYYNGILGMPFIRHYHKTNLDFKHMSLATTEERDYEPVRGKFGHDTDKHYLRRQRQTLTCGQLMDKQEQIFLDLMIALGKIDKTEAVSCCQSLRREKSDFYSPYTEAECLFALGKYQEAGTLLQQVLEGKYAFISLNDKDKEELRNLFQAIRPFEKEQALHISGEVSDVVFSSDLPKKIKINGKKTEARADISIPHTLISAATAKKRKVRILSQSATGTYGIIPEIDLGGLIISNIPCQIVEVTKHSTKGLPDKGKGLLLGFGTLKHFAQLTLSDQQILCSTQTKSAPHGARLYFTGNWYIETTAEGTYPTYQLSFEDHCTGASSGIHIGERLIEKSEFTPIETPNLDAAAGTIGFGYLIQNFGTVTLNLKEMSLFLR